MLKQQSGDIWEIIFLGNSLENITFFSMLYTYNKQDDGARAHSFVLCLTE